MNDANAEWKSEAIGRFNQGDTIRTDRFRDSEHSRGERLTSRMLYDHHADPYENVNVVKSLDHAADELKGQLATVGK